MTEGNRKWGLRGKGGWVGVGVGVGGGSGGWEWESRNGGKIRGPGKRDSSIILVSPPNCNPRRKIKITVIAEFFGATPSRQKISATSRASGVRAQARQFKNRLSTEVADIFIPLTRNENSAMTVINSKRPRPVPRTRYNSPTKKIPRFPIFPCGPTAFSVIIPLSPKTPDPNPTPPPTRNNECH